MSTDFSPELYQQFWTGWLKDKPDLRDYPYPASRPDPKPAVDLRPWFSPPYDQGRTNTCVAQAIAGAVEYFSNRGIIPPLFRASRLFLYWVGRVATGVNPRKDIGMSIRGGMKGATRYGLPLESRWPWDPEKVNEEPPITAYSNAPKTLIVRYERLPVDVSAIKHALQNDFPVVAGFKVFSSYYSVYTYATGVVPVPKENEAWRGGHAVLIVGYDDNRERFIFRNSYGRRWGDGGYGYLPYAMVKFMGDSDLWVITSVRSSIREVI